MNVYNSDIEIAKIENYQIKKEIMNVYNSDIEIAKIENYQIKKRKLEDL